MWHWKVIIYVIAAAALCLLGLPLDRLPCVPQVPMSCEGAP